MVGPYITPLRFAVELMSGLKFNVESGSDTIDITRALGGTAAGGQPVQ